MELADSFGRRFRYLRISLTEQCNFSCVYCLPNGYQGGRHPATNLNPKEIFRLVDGFVDLGVTKIRFTGGEPTLRKDLLKIAESVAQFPQIKTLALSTNGHNLEDLATGLKAAGFTNLNVSLDDINSSEFLSIRGRDLSQKVIRGIDKALEVGFPWVKINSVLMKHDFIDRIARFAQWIQDKPVTVRFIELMQTKGREEFHKSNHLDHKIVLEWLKNNGWVALNRDLTAGPAVEFAHKNSKGKFGVIAPYGSGFCDSCNRLRITSQGHLQLCLFGNGTTSLREFLQDDFQRADLHRKVFEVLKLKKPSHYLQDGDSGSNVSFSSIGG